MIGEPLPSTWLMAKCHATATSYVIFFMRLRTCAESLQFPIRLLFFKDLVGGSQLYLEEGARVF